MEIIIKKKEIHNRAAYRTNPTYRHHVYPGHGCLSNYLHIYKIKIISYILLYVYNYIQKKEFDRIDRSMHKLQLDRMIEKRKAKENTVISFISRISHQSTLVYLQ